MIEIHVDTDASVLQNLGCPFVDFDLILYHLGVGDFKFPGNEGLVVRF
jgi:hypothetical protein